MKNKLYNAAVFKTSHVHGDGWYWVVPLEKLFFMKSDAAPKVYAGQYTNDGAFTITEEEFKGRLQLGTIDERREFIKFERSGLIFPLQEEEDGMLYFVSKGWRTLSELADK